MGLGQAVGGGAVPLCGQGGLGLCPKLGCHGLAFPEWRTGLTLHLLMRLRLAVIAAQLVNIPARWYLNECTADSLNIFRTAVTVQRCHSVPYHGFFGDMYVSLSLFMHHVTSRWQ